MTEVLGLGANFGFRRTLPHLLLYLWDAGVGPAGKTASNSLERSNVDIAQELTSMIETQRTYSTNAKVIQTSDEMLDELTRLKR